MAVIHYGNLSIDLPDDQALTFYGAALRHLASGKVNFLGLPNHGEQGDRIVTITPGVPLAVEFHEALTDGERSFLSSQTSQ